MGSPSAAGEAAVRRRMGPIREATLVAVQDDPAQSGAAAGGTLINSAGAVDMDNMEVMD